MPRKICVLRRNPIKLLIRIDEDMGSVRTGNNWELGISLKPQLFLDLQERPTMILTKPTRRIDLDSAGHASLTANPMRTSQRSPRRISVDPCKTHLTVHIILNPQILQIRIGLKEKRRKTLVDVIAAVRRKLLAM
ncbi:hypothetical protein Acr_00g0089070 [Actinidia rufa]|uniref:Uncharacterized protein n=1 Tax=Actinidia rufa TaxID=165716 RepID=A0A7J0DX72_9ERIC|nr:hypothetical protein Acr_00g0089070 [Actinidia rufa]